MDFDVSPNPEYKPKDLLPKLADVSNINEGSRKFDCSIMFFPDRDDIESFSEEFNGSKLRMYKANMAIVSTFKSSMMNNDSIVNNDDIQEFGTIGDKQGFKICNDSSWKENLTFRNYTESVQSLANSRNCENGLRLS